MSLKLDYKKDLKGLYLPSEKTPSLVQVPLMTFICIDGKGGNPDKNPDFQEAVGALYGLAYTIKMMPKKGYIPPGYTEFVVNPLEGLWWMDGQKESWEKMMEKPDQWRWRLMIMQPGFVTPELFERAQVQLAAKRPSPEIEKLELTQFEEGTSVQMMHVGPYSEEPRTIALMQQFMAENGLREHGFHHEIYLSDPRRATLNNLRTVLRQPVESI